MCGYKRCACACVCWVVWRDNALSPGLHPVKGYHIVTDTASPCYHSEQPWALLVGHKPDLGLTGSGQVLASVSPLSTATASFSPSTILSQGPHKWSCQLVLVRETPAPQRYCRKLGCQRDSASFLSGVLLPCKCVGAERYVWVCLDAWEHPRTTYNIIFQWVYQRRLMGHHLPTESESRPSFRLISFYCYNNNSQKEKSLCC